jgi:hypothetical protein
MVYRHDLGDSAQLELKLAMDRHQPLGTTH